MSETEQIIAICELCEWTYDTSTKDVVFVQDGEIIGIPWPSLDAMHEAEKTLNSNDRVRFYWMLSEVVNPMQTADKCTFSIIHSTASQRAEAFLKTIGKWK